VLDLNVHETMIPQRAEYVLDVVIETISEWNEYLMTAMFAIFMFVLCLYPCMHVSLLKQ